MNRKHLYRSLSILVGGLFFLLALHSCHHSGDGYDPEKPVALKPGDYWLDVFDSRSMQNGVIRNDKLYCNTINMRSGQDYFYCLNLRSGKVEWMHAVEHFASEPAVISDRLIYFSTYLGELHCMDLEGHCNWQRTFELPNGGFFVDPVSRNMVVYSVMEGVWEYDYQSGQVIDKSRKLKDIKAFLADEQHKIVPMRPYTRKIPSAHGLREVEISQESTPENGYYELVLTIDD